MRTLKFRAWHKDKKEMLYDGFGINAVGTLCVGYISLATSEDPMIIMQYTGLKDKNGEDIWEGDLLEHEGYGVGVVKHSLDHDHEYHLRHDPMVREEGFMSAWGIQTARYGQICFTTFANWCRPSVYMKNIGNIYENPDLLTPPKGGKSVCSFIKSLVLAKVLVVK